MTKVVTTTFVSTWQKYMVTHIERDRTLGLHLNDQNPVYVESRIIYRDLTKFYINTVKCDDGRHNLLRKTTWALKI